MRFVDSPRDLAHADLVIIPGTKSTIGDLAWIRESGLADSIRERRAAGTPILGICGGFQMLGERVVDVLGVEQSGDAAGLGLLPAVTHFEQEKITRQVTAHRSGANALWDVGSFAQEELVGYEIHMGRTVLNGDAPPLPSLFRVFNGSHHWDDGLVSTDGLVLGTYMHGLLENRVLRRALVAKLAGRKGIHYPCWKLRLGPRARVTLYH